ncbi:hypothetical protein J2W48_004094 [Flavobacterium piscis]|uniref:Uncharacterized protein n=1 Tax=Flavobacterium piscis TaxID=1114874 RepID=A0ABU1YD24_9FLAO|nr:hypothetical protein [Flavobacterium piscis]
MKKKYLLFFIFSWFSTFSEADLTYTANTNFGNHASCQWLNPQAQTNRTCHSTKYNSTNWKPT